MLAIYLTTLSGTPFLLAGQEIGMANLGENYGADAYIDVEAKGHYNAVLEARGGDKSQMGDVLREMQLKARDHGRLPMQWDDSTNAGFTTSDAKPWMTINKDYPEWNVASQVDDPDSVLAFYKQMLALRKEYLDLFVYGTHKDLPESKTGEMVIGWKRHLCETDQNAVVLLNFSATPQRLKQEYQALSVLIDNGRCHVGAEGIELGPFGGVVLLG